MPKHKTSGMENKNETSTLALGQKVGANEKTCVMPTGMRTAENTRLKASKGESSRTSPVALRTKTRVEPSRFEPLIVDINTLLFSFHCVPPAAAHNERKRFVSVRPPRAAARRDHP